MYYEDLRKLAERVKYKRVPLNKVLESGILTNLGIDTKYSHKTGGRDEFRSRVVKELRKLADKLERAPKREVKASEVSYPAYSNSANRETDNPYYQNPSLPGVPHTPFIDTDHQFEFGLNAMQVGVSPEARYSKYQGEISPKITGYYARGEPVNVNYGMDGGRRTRRSKRSKQSRRRRS